MNVLRNIKGSYVSGKTPVVASKCMSCGKPIENPTAGIDGRRFCSQACKKEYMG